MATPTPLDSKLGALLRPLLASGGMRFIAHLGLCAAFLQGGLVKLYDFPGAVAEMSH